MGKEFKKKKNHLYRTNEYPLSGKTRISIICPNGEKVWRISCSVRQKIKITLSYIKILQILSFSVEKLIPRCYTGKAPIPVSPEVTPPQYTVQLLGLDWFTTSSYDSCLVFAEDGKFDIFNSLNKIFIKKNVALIMLLECLQNTYYIWLKIKPPRPRMS